MALPLNNTPVYNQVVPSIKKTVKYRPFLVKDQKALMIAQQSEDQKVMVDTLKSVISSCVLDEIDIDSLAMFDLEYMFTQLRAKSVGETVDLIMSCDEDHGEQNEKARLEYTLNINDIQVTKNPEHTNKIALYDNVGVVMRYPTIQTLSKLENLKADTIDDIFDIVASSIDFIYQGDEVFYGKEQSKEDLLEFLNNLTSEQFKKIQKFFETMPRLKQEVDYNCPVCGLAHHKVLEGLQSFF